MRTFVSLLNHGVMSCVSAFVLVLVAGCSSSDSPNLADEDEKRPQSTGSPAAQETQSTDRENLADLIERLEPAVVRLDVKTENGAGVGSGFVIRKDGIVVTNHHVVDGAQAITAEFSTGKKVDVKGILALVPEKDIALVTLNDAGPFPALELSDSIPRKGDSVIAFGSPKGFSFSASEGIVSGIRSAADLQKFDLTLEGTWIQTTAPISPGNSGGPLIDERGNVVAVNTFVHTNAQNLNLSISAGDIQTAFDGTSGKTAVDLSKALATATSHPPTVGGRAETVTIPRKREFLHNFQITIEKDRFEGHSTVTLTDVEVLRNLDMQAFFVLTEKPPSHVYVRFTSSTDDWRYLKYHTVKFLVDGKPLPVDSVKHTGDVISGGVLEFIWVDLPLADFVRLANAKDVEVKVGIDEFRLHRNQLEAVRDIASRIPTGKLGSTTVRASEQSNQPIDGNNEIGVSLDELQLALSKFNYRPFKEIEKHETGERIHEGKMLLGTAVVYAVGNPSNLSGISLIVPIAKGDDSSSFSALLRIRADPIAQLEKVLGLASPRWEESSQWLREMLTKDGDLTSERLQQGRVDTEKNGESIGLKIVAEDEGFDLVRLTVYSESFVEQLENAATKQALAKKEEREKEANTIIASAQTLIQSGHVRAAKKKLQIVLDKYKDTTAAIKVQTLLEVAEAKTNEKVAASKLRLAKQLMDSGNIEKARERLKELIEEYPETKAAIEARKLLGLPENPE